MQNFTHYLITRFNIPASNWKYDKNNVIVQDEVWLKKRICLFEQFCFPSIQGQTCKNFVWLVYFDENSPKLLLDKIEEWRICCENFHPLYSTCYDNWQKNEISEFIKNDVESDFVITTRLDNDDALHCRAIELIQESFVAKDNVIIDLPNGFCYNTKTNLFSKNVIKSSPFISYVESTKKHIDTVYREGHPAWIGKAEFISLQERLWIQVIHDSNIANSQHGRISRCSDLKSYNVSILPPPYAKILHARITQEYYLLKHRIKMMITK